MKTDKILDAPGHACTLLTPLIKEAMISLDGEEILKVSNDDPASRLGVPAWCRLTGNKLVEMIDLDAARTEFYIRKKNL
ncbi:MAG: sulfurtransferase TusA family protein [Saprospiraceae bacterium]